MQGMSDKLTVLSSKNDEFCRLSEQKAQAEYTLNVAIADKVMTLKADGTPATLINSIVKGDKLIAQYKMNYDNATVIAKACEKSMRILEAGIDVDRSQLSWLKAEMQSH